MAQIYCIDPVLRPFYSSSNLRLLVSQSSLLSFSPSPLPLSTFFIFPPSFPPLLSFLNPSSLLVFHSPPAVRPLDVLTPVILGNTYLTCLVEECLGPTSYCIVADLLLRVNAPFKYVVICWVSLIIYYDMALY